ncbi:Nicotinamide-nucleotide amidohydrolase PncC [compost metagenome]
MAEGALLNSRAQVALSITGVAGPNGGTPEKPVGMVCFGWSNRITTIVETQRFRGDRAQIRRQAAEHAMRGLVELLRNEA